jgi:hypothetical protein
MLLCTVRYRSYIPAVEYKENTRSINDLYMWCVYLRERMRMKVLLMGGNIPVAEYEENTRSINDLYMWCIFA